MPKQSYKILKTSFNTVNPQKIVRLSFQSLVFLVKLFSTLQICIRQKIDTWNESPWCKGLKYDIKLKNFQVCLTLHRIRTQLKLGATMFWGRLIFEDLRYLVRLPFLSGIAVYISKIWVLSSLWLVDFWICISKAAFYMYLCLHSFLCIYMARIGIREIKCKAFKRHMTSFAK